MSRNVRRMACATALMLAGLGSILSTTVRAQKMSSCPLSISVSYTPVQQLSFADIDFEHFESRTLLFTLNIGNTGTDTATAILSLNISIRLASGAPLSSIPRVQSDEFKIPPGGRIVTNLDIGGSSDIKFGSLNLPEDVKENVQDVALATGKFPAGNYSFLFSLANAQCGTISAPPAGFVLSAPSRVELRSPRDGEITNEFPLFEFFSDGDRVTLTIAEKLSDQSREDAITHKPAMLETDLVGQNSFLYSGGRPLEQGKTYVWRVVSKTRGSGGTDVEVSSPIGLFIVSDVPSSGGQTTASASDAILNQLEEMLGPRYAAVFQQIRRGGFKLTGRYDLDGKTLSQSELLDLLNELRAIADNIDLTFE